MAASESSCAHEKAVAKRGGEAESALEVSSPQRRSWVALASIPLLCSGDDATRAEEMAPGVADLILELHEPPRASYLALPERVAHDYKRGAEDGILPRILAAAPARLLISGVDYMYWCDVRAGTAYQLPAVPENLPVNMFPEPNIGLVADPSCPGEYMLVHLHPTPQASRMRHSALLCFSTAARGRRWFFKPLDCSPDHKPWHTHGVVAHDGMLCWHCWVDVAYGILWCNPFDENPGLRLVPLPNGCAMPGTANRVYFSRLLDKRRCVRLSEGKLRYIQITATGLSHNLATMNDPPDNPTVSMWTLKALADMDAGDPWTPEYQVAFTDIWNHHKYIAAGLPRGKVPNLALVDPNNHYVIYFFHEKSLFAWDVIAAELVSCEENLVDFDYQNLELQYSRFVEAWDPASPDGKHACPIIHRCLIHFASRYGSSPWNAVNSVLRPSQSET
jgi:hypothetical protein